MNSFTPDLQRILCIGGGPAGLYFALLMKARQPSLEVTVVERNRPFDTFGWGVVLSDQTLANLAAADAETAAPAKKAPAKKPAAKKPVAKKPAAKKTAD